MHTSPDCPDCGKDNTWSDGTLFSCPDCGHEWAPGDAAAGGGPVVRDCNGNPLEQGDSVVVIKDLKVRGSSVPLKQGTMIRNIRLVADDPEHIEGHSDRIRDLVLKTCFLRKA
ncbi:alkylphosphonate utilization protein [Lysobacter sp. GX 14042]|uniref:zinc ribbon domain-containing protein YjdM n=1 Tax=Lysobacter sp. GX 14042 TaxID=2907155 RepID=UPI001F2D2717|nr:zinc ribbon domain-containing protein YjdM [Lysobacter sp. GX 14042]MCE7032952.1 alkylphosphonate utilization protein [Lysobacter sp. GX 14042]